MLRTRKESYIQMRIQRSSRRILPYLIMPEYLLSPRQAGLRALHQINKGGHREQITLPWGAPVVIDTSDNMGKAIWKTGVYDLTVAEALLRLTDAGELALDVGANIGLMSSALACAVGSAGRVVSFEPNPKLFPSLQENVALWRDQQSWGRVELANIALSAANGEATLTIPADYAQNNGLATLEPGDGERLTVQTRTLDSFLGAGESVGTMKLDVEGHEDSVLAGANDLLSSGRIRDVVFEDHGTYPTPTMRRLESLGYEVFLLRKGLLGPQLTPVAQPSVSYSNDPPNYLASRDPARASYRLAEKGWRALRRR